METLSVVIRKEKTISREITLDILDMLIKKPMKLAELSEIIGSRDYVIQKHLSTLEEFRFISFFQVGRARVWYPLVARIDTVKLVSSEEAKPSM